MCEGEHFGRAFVGEHDRRRGVVRLDTEERLAQRAAAFAQHIVGLQRKDSAEREDKRLHVLHVQVVGRHGVRHRVGGHRL